MGLNQFAKISPVVNSAGYLLEQKENGTYELYKDMVRLKNNETGICIDDNSVLVMLGENNPVKLTGGLYSDMESAQDYVNSNENGKYNGQLVVVKSNPSNLYIIIGKQLYNLTENTTKTIVVNLSENFASNGIFKTIENLDIQSEKEYLINTIDVKFPGTSYEFEDNTASSKIWYPAISINGSSKGNVDIKVTDSCFNNITKVTVDDIFKGKLEISMKVLEDNEVDTSKNTIVSYYGDTITLIITYTILN